MSRSERLSADLSLDEAKYFADRHDSEPCKKSEFIADETFDVDDNYMQNQMRLMRAFRKPSKELEAMIAETKNSLKKIGAIK